MIFEVQLSSPYRVIRLEADSVYPSHDMIQFTVGNNVGHMFPASSVISVTTPLNVINSDVPAGISEGRRAVVTQDAPEFIELLNRSQYAPAILSDSIARPRQNDYMRMDQAIPSPYPPLTAYNNAAPIYPGEDYPTVRAPYTEAQALAHIGTADRLPQVTHMPDSTVPEAAYDRYIDRAVEPQMEVRAIGGQLVAYNNSTTRMDAEEADF